MIGFILQKRQFVSHEDRLNSLKKLLLHPGAANLSTVVSPSLSLKTKQKVLLYYDWVYP